jgi:hypothetical protein
MYRSWRDERSFRAAGKTLEFPGGAAVAEALAMRTSLVLAGFFLLGCSGADNYVFGGPSAGTPWSDATDAGVAPDASAPRDDDAGTTGAGDSGAPSDAHASDASGGKDASAPANAFTNAPPYVAQTGPTTIRNGHTFDPNLNPAGRACLSCHTGFLVGGSVYKDVGGTIPAPQVEVRVRDANGNAASVYTDNAGNFFLPKTSAPNVTLPALVGARDSTSTVLMTATVTNGSCAAASCHVSGGQGPIHL